jgi:hypothetical protein
MIGLKIIAIIVFLATLLLAGFWAAIGSLVVIGIIFAILAA